MSDNVLRKELEGAYCRSSFHTTGMRSGSFSVIHRSMARVLVRSTEHASVKVKRT